jgi:hypothetical protein
MCIADDESKVISFTPAAARAAAKNLTVTATYQPPFANRRSLTWAELAE